MKFHSQLLSLILLTLLFTACNDNDSGTANSETNNGQKNPLEASNNGALGNIAMNPLYKDLDVKPLNFLINNSRDTLVEVGINNTCLDIKAGTFVYQDGTPVQGEVSLNYREFRTAAEIILSGITMKYDSAGTTYDFQTAGMFEIAGSQNGEAVKIAPNKELMVKLESKQPESNYNYYSLNEDQKNWSYINTPAVSKEGSKQTAQTNASSSSNDNKLTNDLSSQNTNLTGKKMGKGDKVKTNADLPVAPQLANDNEQLWDFEYDFIQYPKFKHLSGVMWQFCGDSADNPKHMKNFNTNYWAPKSILPHVEKEGVFMVKLGSEKQKLEVEMRPVYKGQHYTAANEEFKEKLAAYNDAVLKSVRQNGHLDYGKTDYPTTNTTASTSTNTASNGSTVTRSVPVSEFGIYNCDRQYRVQGIVELIAQADLDFSLDLDLHPKIFLVASEGTAVINYNTLNNVSKFRYSKYEDNKLIVLYPNKRIATFSNKDFKKISKNVPITSDANPLLFELETHDAPIASAEELDAIIQSL